MAVSLSTIKGLILAYIGGAKLLPQFNVNIDTTMTLRQLPSLPTPDVTSILKTAGSSLGLANITDLTDEYSITQQFIENPVQIFDKSVSSASFVLGNDLARAGLEQYISTSERNSLISTLDGMKTNVVGNTALISHTDILVGRAAQPEMETFRLKTVFDSVADAQGAAALGIPETVIDNVGSALKLGDPTHALVTERSGETWSLSDINNSVKKMIELKQTIASNPSARSWAEPQIRDHASKIKRLTPKMPSAISGDLIDTDIKKQKIGEKKAKIMSQLATIIAPSLGDAGIPSSLSASSPIVRKMTSDIASAQTAAAATLARNAREQVLAEIPSDPDLAPANFTLD